MTPWKLILFSKRDDDQGLTLSVESAPGTWRPIVVPPSGIFDRWQSLDAASGERASFLQRIVADCEARYPRGADFGHCLWVDGKDDITEVRQELHPGLLPCLPTRKALLETRRIDSSIAMVSMSELSNASTTPPSMTYRTSLVVWKNQLYIAKGPTDARGVDETIFEVGILNSLPRHRSIIGPPVALVSISTDDDRVIGYLLKYYPNGNVRDYAIENRSRLSLEILRKWSAQIAGVLAHLLYQCNLTYVDIKPDNFLVDTDQNLVLADFSDEGSTTWIAAPELPHGCSINVSTDDKVFLYSSTKPPNTASVSWQLDSIPTHWPREARDKAMVFSVGRSLWMIWEAIPLDKFTMAAFRPAGDFDPARTIFTPSTSSLPQEMKDFVLRCVSLDPKERPTLAEVEAFFSTR